MKTHAIRLQEGADLKIELIRFTKERNIQAGIILTTVGSLSKAVLRMAGAEKTLTWEEELEIISLVGTLGPDGPHLHLSASKENGDVIGGHVKDKCIVRTTAEIVIGEVDNYTFRREFDDHTGYDELKVEES